MLYSSPSDGNEGEVFSLSHDINIGQQKRTIIIEDIFDFMTDSFLGFGIAPNVPANNAVSPDYHTINDGRHGTSTTDF